MPNRFQADLAFLQAHAETLVLGDPRQRALVLVPAYQGRVMTSTAGPADRSFGWINHDLIRSGQRVPQINLYGGEERFWLAPEGGRFSLFFPPSPLEQPLTFADWRVPTCIDTDPFEVVTVESHAARFCHTATLENRCGTGFDIGFDRWVRLLDETELAAALGTDPSDWTDCAFVAHESENTLRNLGDRAWDPATGLLAVWVLGMNAPSPHATLIVPYRDHGVESQLPIVNADYFGRLGPDRLVVDTLRKVIFLRGDGQFRSKLGLTYPRAVPYLGAWDRSSRVLTIVKYNLPVPAAAGPATDGLTSGGDSPTCSPCLSHPLGVGYVNNVWQVMEDEYAGDVINGYNDGPNESGGRLGGFFELESLSPALALQPQQSYTHRHLTVHLEADDDRSFAAANALSHRLFGIGLDELPFQA
jgi:hypothetical protein